MIIEEAIPIVLMADAGVFAITGSRIKPGFLKQFTEYPAVAFSLLSRDSMNTDTLAWEERGHAQIVESRFRFLSMSKGKGNLLAAKRLDEALRLALVGYAGPVTNSASPPETVTIQGVFADTCRDAYDDETETNIVDRVLRIVHSEVRPDPINP